MSFSREIWLPHQYRVTRKKEANIVIIDEVKIQVQGLDPVSVNALIGKYTFFAPGYKFHPAYKSGNWDGKISLMEPDGTTYLYFVNEIHAYLTSKGYVINYIDTRKDWSHVTSKLKPVGPDYLVKNGKGDKLLRDYQVRAVNEAMKHGHGILEMGTGSGKTLTMVTLADIYSRFGKVTVIVDSTDLIFNTVSTFSEVGIDVGIWYDSMKEWKHVNVGTWQSLRKSPELVHDSICIIVDEVHRAKGKVVQDLISNHAGNTPFRFGFTGTVPKEKLSRMVLFGSLGPVIIQKKSKELQDEGYLSKVVIYQVKLNDIKNTKLVETVKYTTDYLDEVNAFLGDEKRLEAICRYIEKIREKYGNVMVLVNNQSHAVDLVERMEGFHLSNGKVPVKKRQEIYQKFIDGEITGIVASYGVASTGIDIPNIAALVLLEPGKSYTRVIQSIGRSLRRSEGKNRAYVFDFVTNLNIAKETMMVERGKARPNRVICEKQARDRLKLYKEQGFEYKVITRDYMTEFFTEGHDEDFDA